MDFPSIFLRKFIPQSNKTFSKLPLGKFFLLDYLREELLKSKNKLEIISQILGLYDKKVEEYLPYEVFEMIIDIYTVNKIESDASFLKPNPNQKVTPKQKEKYEYEYRHVAEWINRFASHYHWSLDEILNLDIDLATYLYQEILLKEFEDREWEYSLTEGAYSYDSNTKKSKYVPMKKPYWMSDADQPKPITKTLIRKDFLPLGEIQELSGITERLAEIPFEQERYKNVH